MTSLATSERALLCIAARQAGPDAPTLCAEWSVRNLVVHLLVRESPAAAGILVRPLGGLVDRAARRLEQDEFDVLVDRLSHGPPAWSPFALPRIGPVLNILEFFVHHEDIRRAQPGWQPRPLPPSAQDAIWRAARHAGRGLLATAGAGVGIVAERTDTGERVRLWPASTSVTVRGLPSEVALYLYGRKAESVVELDGDAEDVARVESTRLGI